MIVISYSGCFDCSVDPIRNLHTSRNISCKGGVTNLPEAECAISFDISIFTANHASRRDAAEMPLSI